LLLVLVKRGLTVSVDYGYFGFGSERSDESGGEVKVFFHGGGDATFWLQQLDDTEETLNGLDPPPQKYFMGTGDRSKNYWG
jgi:hypothetical protein